MDNQENSEKPQENVESESLQTSESNESSKKQDTNDSSNTQETNDVSYKQPESEEKPAPEVIRSQPDSVEQPSAITIVLGWLTYAFWGWLIIALIWLSNVVIESFFNVESSTESLPYAISGTLVLLPIAFVCDMLYRKKEALKKVGASQIIMIIHAVIFALLGIGALISAVFALVNFLVESSNDSDLTIRIISIGVIATLLYAAAFLRTLNPAKSERLPKRYSYAMIAITAVLLILAIVGPVSTSFRVKNDKNTESALRDVHYQIQFYAIEKKQLPKSLDELNIKDTATKQQIRENKIEYKIDEPLKERSSLNSSTTYLLYQLCANFDYAKEPSYHSGYYARDSQTGYSNSINVDSHTKGRNCFKLQERVDNYNENPILFEPKLSN